VFFGVEAQMARHIAMDERAGGHHLGVQQRMAAQQAVEIAAVAVRPIHHGGNGQAPEVGLRHVHQNQVVA
jgi:hypothetical protein